jgi:hypothetical protein
MKSHDISWPVLTLLALLADPPCGFAQGSLTPPGPPGPTMKTLQQIEPRTPISSLPVTITAPGSYYLTTNATVAGTAILLQSSNVTVDLNGFTLSGDGGTTDYGVWVNPTSHVQNVTVRDGRFHNFAGAVSVGGEGADNILVENIQMHTSTRSGIWIGANCNGAVVRNNLLVDCNTPLRLTAFPGQSIRGVTFAHNRVSGGSSDGVSLHGQDGAIRDVAVLNNQVAGTLGNALVVSTFGTGTVSRVLIDQNHFTKTNGFLGCIIPTNAAVTLIRNVFSGLTLSIGTTGNTIGPIITTTGTLGTNGAAMSPWANFQN